jgi:hypothetical protein
MLTLLEVALVLALAWGGFCVWRRLRVMQAEIDLMMGELHKLRLESVRGKPRLIR